MHDGHFFYKTAPSVMIMFDHSPLVDHPDHGKSAWNLKPTTRVRAIENPQRSKNTPHKPIDIHCVCVLVIFAPVFSFVLVLCIFTPLLCVVPLLVLIVQEFFSASTSSSSSGSSYSSSASTPSSATEAVPPSSRNEEHDGRTKVSGIG